MSSSVFHDLTVPVIIGKKSGKCFQCASASASRQRRLCHMWRQFQPFAVRQFLWWCASSYRLLCHTWHQHQPCTLRQRKRWSSSRQCQQYPTFRQFHSCTLHRPSRQRQRCNTGASGKYIAPALGMKYQSQWRRTSH